MMYNAIMLYPEKVLKIFDLNVRETKRKNDCSLCGGFALPVA